VMCQVSEVYVRWVQIAYSLVWTLVVPVIHEFPVGRIHAGFAEVRLMERLDLADRRRPPYACDDMFDAVSSAELREF
jgi:hypothetical protein